MSESGANNERLAIRKADQLEDWPNLSFHLRANVSRQRRIVDLPLVAIEQVNLDRMLCERNESSPL